MHPRVLASPQILMPLPGMCTRADAPAPLPLVARALQHHVRPEATMSHTTALELLGLPVPRKQRWAEGEPLHCRAGPGGHRSVTPRIVMHAPRAVADSEPPNPLTAVATIHWRGIALRHPLLALQECAHRFRPDDLVVCIDALAGQKAEIAIPLPRIRELAAGLQGRGSKAVKEAAEAAAENVWSPMETTTRLLLTRNGFPPPLANLRIDDPDTAWHGYLDLAYPQWKIAIEYDSEDHRLDRLRWQRDLHKDQILHQLGWVVLRISVADIREPERFLQRLTAAVSRAAAA